MHFTEYVMTLHAFAGAALRQGVARNDSRHAWELLLLTR